MTRSPPRSASRPSRPTARPPRMSCWPPTEPATSPSAEVGTGSRPPPRVSRSRPSSRSSRRPRSTRPRRRRPPLTGRHRFSAQGVTMDEMRNPGTGRGSCSSGGSSPPVSRTRPGRGSPAADAAGHADPDPRTRPRPARHRRRPTSGRRRRRSRPSSRTRSSRATASARSPSGSRRRPEHRVLEPGDLSVARPRIRHVPPGLPEARLGPPGDPECRGRPGEPPARRPTLAGQRADRRLTEDSAVGPLSCPMSPRRAVRPTDRRRD